MKIATLILVQTTAVQMASFHLVGRFVLSVGSRPSDSSLAATMRLWVLIVFLAQMRLANRQNSANHQIHFQFRAYGGGTNVVFSEC